MLEMAFSVAVAILSIVVAFKLARRLGYEGTTGLLMMFPVVNYIVLAVWAFCESPNERKIRELQSTINHLEAVTGQSPVALLEQHKEVL
jgi:predicted membrane channel-forming protein YqfA (hemolysin III family)